MQPVLSQGSLHTAAPLPSQRCLMLLRLAVGLLLLYEGSAQQGSAHCWDVTDFGAIGDGVFDCTAAFNTAAAKAAATGGCVRVPAVPKGGGYAITDTVELSPGVKVVGEYVGSPAVPHCYPPPGDLNTTGGSRLEL